MVEAEFSMTANELFQLILLLTEELTHRPTLAFAFLPSAEQSIREPVLALCDRISQSSNALRSLMVERQSFDVNWAYSFNSLRAFPLVHAGNPRSVMCPAPPILLQRLTDGLYFDLIRADRGFGNAIGEAFEFYVGNVARKIVGDRFELHEEARWGKPERRGVDWIMADGGGTLFVECKLGRLDIASQTEIAPMPPLVAAIERLAGNIGQLYATLSEALAGGYPYWQPNDRPVYPVLVTFHEWFCFGPFFYRHLDALLATEFDRRGLDRSLVERHPFTICSIAEFEGLVTACLSDGIDTVLSSKNDVAHRQWLMRGFLADRYPGSFSNAVGTFEEGMDQVIEGPSRLTGR